MRDRPGTARASRGTIMDKDTTASTNFAKVLLSELECISHRRTEPPWYVISSGEGDAAAQATERSQASALENQPARVADGATAGDGSAPRSDQEEERRRAAEVALLEAWGRESHRAHQLAEDEELRRFDEEVLKEARRQALTPALQALEEQRRELLRKARAERMNLGDEERSLRAQKDQARAEAETRARQQAEAKQRQEREKRRLEADERDREKADLDEVRRLAKELEGRPKSATGEMEEKLLEKTRACARDMDLVALAFSGGGIRSATFCLGVLQGLAG